MSKHNKPMPESQEQLNIIPLTSPPPKGEGALSNLKIALVHDFLIYPGGAEKVLEVLAEMFPEAPIYTLLYDKEGMRSKFQGKDIRTSFLQKFPKFLRKHHQWLLPFYPVAPEMFDLRDFDLVISSSGAWSKGIVTKLNVIHIAYIHSPMRFIWDRNGSYLKENKKEKFKLFVRPFLSYLRIWDKLASERPDYLIANSKFTEERIKKYYRKESVIIYPPVKNPPLPLREDARRAGEGTLENTEIPLPSPPPKGEGVNGGYFLVVSRLSPYKKVDKVIEAFNKLGLPLIIVGEGKQEKYLKSIAKDNIQILGWQSEEKIAELYAKARAFVFAGLDDFGIAPVEAMSFGVPVIALRDGGAMETVVEGKTGEFFDAATPEVIADGIRRFMENEEKYDREFIKENAKRFSKERFVREMREFIEKAINNFP